MSVVKDKIVLCQIGLADFSIESVNQVPFYKRYSEFCRLFASKIPAVDFESYFAQPQENNAKKTIEWYFKPGAEAPMKLTELKDSDHELYHSLTQQRNEIVSNIRTAYNNSNENDQKYLNAVLAGFDEDYIDSITYSYDGHILIGIWGMRTKKGRQIDSVITEGVLDHRAFRVMYKIKGIGQISPFSSINRRYGHILYGDKDIPRVIPDDGYSFKEWVPEAPHGKEVKSDMVYTAVCVKNAEVIKPPEVDGPGSGGDVVVSDPEVFDNNKCLVFFSAGDHGSLSGQDQIEKSVGETIQIGEIPYIEADEGYKFLGWDKNPDGYVVTENVKFVAQYEDIEEEQRYEIRFSEGDHGILHGQTIYEKHRNDKVLPNEVPEVEPNEEYRFIGWDKEPDNHVVIEDVVFVAQYEDVKKTWWNRFWGWGGGCLNWLLTLLLLVLIGLLLWYLFGGYRNFNFCGCDCDDVIPPSPSEQVVYPEGVCGEVTESGGEQGIVKSIQLGQPSGTFLFKYNTFSIAVKIVIYNGKQPQGTPIFQYEGGTEGEVSDYVSFNSSDGYITVVVEGKEPGTEWVFEVNCPEPNSEPAPHPQPAPEPVLKPCDELQKSGSNTPESYIFDMGQDFGSFIFEYATGGIYSDKIIIYNGENNEGEEIFRYDGTTGDSGWDDRQTRRVQFSNQKIYIEITPNGSSGTYWEIKVNCP